MKLKDIKKMMGTIVDADWVIKADNILEATGMDVPESFDSAENWPDCADNINKVRDQANCGSCWAFGTTDALNNRRCIAGESDASELLSEADTCACCGFLSCFSMGCNGGQVGTPWNWFKNTGVVTGGDFGASGFCYDYTMPQCAHHIDPTPERPDCSEIKQVDPVCGSTCPDDSSITYSSDKKKAASSYGLGSV